MLMSAYCNMQQMWFKSVQAMSKINKLFRRQLSFHEKRKHSLSKQSHQRISFIMFIFHAADRPTTLHINVCQLSFLYFNFMCSSINAFYNCAQYNINPIKEALKAENFALSEDHIFYTTFSFNSKAYSFAEK